MPRSATLGVRAIASSGFDLGVGESDCSVPRCGEVSTKDIMGVANDRLGTMEAFMDAVIEYNKHSERQRQAAVS